MNLSSGAPRMCGIAGIVGRTAVRAEAVRRMNRLQVHRGPDDEGIWTSRDRRVVLGHTRLSIIDPTPSGHQPMTDGASAITFDRRYTTTSKSPSGSAPRASANFSAERISWSGPTTSPPGHPATGRSGPTRRRGT